jgi:hypothetical protein
MSRVRSKSLYELIKSLTKSEKRYFKLQMSSSGSSEDKKVVKLFDEINNQDEFDEEKILFKIEGIKKEQLSNLKAYLFQKILQSLRQFNASKIPEIRIREQIDYAHILFNKRNYEQGLECLKNAKKLAKEFDQLELMLDIINMEKSAIMPTIDNSNNAEKIDDIIAEVEQINSKINKINSFSNLAIKLNSLYTKSGYIKDENELLTIKELFYTHLPFYKEAELSLSEKIHLYKLHIGFNFYIQDFESGYIFSKKLVDTLENSPSYMKKDLGNYIKSLNTLLAAQYKLHKYKEFIVTFEKLKVIVAAQGTDANDNMRITLEKYYYTHEINRYFMLGKFSDAIEQLIDDNDKKLIELVKILDKHSQIIFHYKFACMYLGAGDHRNAVKWLNEIINMNEDSLREDIHCFARMINLICHYELKNFDVINYYIRSTYRYLLKKDDLHQFQKSILNFLRTLTRIPNKEELKLKFSTLKDQLLPLENSRYEKRAFVYFDIISWLESKIQEKPVEYIIEQKAKFKNL